VLGWERLNTLIAEVDKVVTVAREDNLSEIVDRYPTVHRMVPILLGTFVFRSWQGFIACRARRAARPLHDMGEKSAVARTDGVFKTDMAQTRRNQRRSAHSRGCGHDDAARSLAIR
jgi:hypothetical protein